MSKSDWAENQTLTTLLGASKYLALSTAATTDAGGITEPSGGAYARILCEWTITNDTATNTNDEDFPLATASWGTITHIAVFDAITGGNMIYHGPLDANVIIDTDDIFRLPAGNLDIVEQ